MAKASHKRTEQLIVENEKPYGEVHPIANGKAAIYTARSPDDKLKNEDAAALFSFDEHSGVLAVADGVGGLPKGAEASEIALRELQNSLQNVLKKKGKLRNGILNGFEAANRAVLAMGQGAGTTLSVVEIQKNTCRSYHAGDSLVLLASQRGKCKWQIVPHSPVGYALEAGNLNEEEALYNPELHLISNMIGSRNMRIDVGPSLKLAKRDTLVLASDGLSDNFLTDEIIERVRTTSLPEVMAKLASDCHERMISETGDTPSKPDDCTFIVFRRS